ncbi:MAG: phosphatase PAP2 family protein [Planctomycetota bacterium]|nr:MAG: phosphatase PAP2 family protein [Planctomycetota bacterium]
MDAIWQWDKHLFYILNQNKIPYPLEKLALWFHSNLNYLIPLAIAMGIAFLKGRPKERRFVAWLLILIIVVGLGNKGLKYIFQRPRPPYTLDKHHLQLRVPRSTIPSSSYSFPSGHSAFFFALALYTSWHYPSLLLILLSYLLASFVAFSRIYLGVHYPLDILGGFASGSTFAALILLLQCHWTKSKTPPQTSPNPQDSNPNKS